MEFTCSPKPLRAALAAAKTACRDLPDGAASVVLVAANNGKVRLIFAPCGEHRGETTIDARVTGEGNAWVSHGGIKTALAGLARARGNVAVAKPGGRLRIAVGAMTFYPGAPAVNDLPIPDPRDASDEGWLTISRQAARVLSCAFGLSGPTPLIVCRDGRFAIGSNWQLAFGRSPGAPDLALDLSAWSARGRKALVHGAKLRVDGDKVSILAPSGVTATENVAIFDGADVGIQMSEMADNAGGFVDLDGDTCRFLKNLKIVSDPESIELFGFDGELGIAATYSDDITASHLSLAKWDHPRAMFRHALAMAALDCGTAWTIASARRVAVLVTSSPDGRTITAAMRDTP